jgi:hypothetical protein
MKTQHILTYSYQKHLDYKIYNMVAFLPFHFHLLRELHVKSLYASKFQHNHYFTYYFHVEARVIFE